jgi:hypothetical protein
VTKTATLAVNPPTPASVVLNPTTVLGGSGSQGTVILTGPAPAGGVSVTLSSNSSAAVVPATAIVAAGSSSTTFTITTSAVSASTAATITAGYGGATQTANLTLTPPPSIQVNCGGAAAGTYIADKNYSGGYTATTSDAISTSGVVSPAPGAVYQSERYGNFTYTISSLVAGASYNVRLHFAEVYYNAAGQRKFNVSINGTQALSQFDIYASAGGQDVAIVREFTATANSSGKIIIQFATGSADLPKCSGIEVIKQ